MSQEVDPLTENARAATPVWFNELDERDCFPGGVPLVSHPDKAFWIDTQEEQPAPSARLATPITILWQEHDPIFPRALADRPDHFFKNYKFEKPSGVGHFTPLQAKEKFAAAIVERLGS